METKQFYKSFKTVIEYINQNPTIHEISFEKGEELAGVYWHRIATILKEKNIGSNYIGRNFGIFNRELLKLIYTDCCHQIEEIEKREADRALDIAVKTSNIKYARRAFWISIGALIVAVTSLLWHIILTTA